MGDVKLALMLGAFLGRSVPVAIMGGLLAAAVPSIALLLVHGRSGRKMTLALGPYLALGGVVALLFGHDVLALVLGARPMNRCASGCNVRSADARRGPTASPSPRRARPRRCDTRRRCCGRAAPRTG